MTAQLKKLIAYSLSIALGVFLLYLALHEVDIGDLKSSLKNASYGWLAPLIATVLISHGLRAWRWQILLEALPYRQRTSELGTISFKTAFLSLLIGYFVNLAVPRLGEVARAGSLSKQEGIRFSGVFGTVVAERVFDVVVLALGITSLSFLLYDQFAFLQNRIFSPIWEISHNISAIWTAVGITFVGAICYVTLRTIKTSQSARLMQLRRKFISLFNSFKDGMFTLLRAPGRVALIGSTLLMWFCYVLMAWLTFVILGMQTSYDLGFAAAWSIMIFGAIGFAIPSPGGTGSFHYITILALVNLYAVDETTAAAYAILSHGLHVVIYIIAGSIAFFVQGTSLKTLRTTTLDSDEK